MENDYCVYVHNTVLGLGTEFTVHCLPTRDTEKFTDVELHKVSSVNCSIPFG